MPGEASYIRLKGSGAPTFKAPETSLYWDEVAKKAYINTDGNVAWQELGSGGASTYDLITDPAYWVTGG